MKNIFILLLFTLLTTSQSAETTTVNLLAGGKFKPVMIQGECCGPQGWRVSDMKRFRNNFVRNRQSVEYLLGRSFFSFKPIKDGMTFIFKKGCSIDLRDENCGQQFWAPSFRFTGEIKLNSGQVTIEGKVYKNYPEWQTIEFSMPQFRTFYVKLEGETGSQISLRNFNITSEYGNKFGELKLPDGGVLKQIVVPANGTFLTFYNTEMWRGWLWKLSGTALEIKTIRSGEPVPKNSFYVTCNKNYPKLDSGGYYLKVDKDGANLIVRRPQTIVSALYNYLREFGYRCYAIDDELIPQVNTNFVLKNVNEIRNPHLTATLQRYNAPQAWYNNSKNGGYDVGQLLAYTNDAYELGWQRFVHTMDFLMPYGKYGKKHPEYFMQLKNGKRWTFAPGHSFRQACVSNPEVKKIIADRILGWMRSTPERIYYPVVFDDGEDFCCCENCKAEDPNPNDGSVSDLLVSLGNYVAERTRKEFPDKMVSILAYTGTTEKAPLRVVPGKNVDVTYAIYQTSWKCRMHVNCACNFGMKDLIDWSKIVPKKNISFWNYGNGRDIKFKTMEKVSEYGSGYLYQDVMDDCQLFCIARWNWGMKMDDAIKEFCHGYYGKAGDVMYASINYLDELAKKYKHTPEDKHKYLVTMFSSYTPCKSVLGRKEFDKLYQFYSQALQLEKDNPKIRARILYRKIKHMISDFSKFPRASAKTKDESQMFAARAVDFIKSNQELYKISKMHIHHDLNRNIGGGTKMGMQNFVNSYLGLQLPENNKLWTESDKVKKFLANPLKEMLTNAKKFDGGWVWPISCIVGPNTINYSYQCAPRPAKVLCRASSKEHIASVVFELSNTNSLPEHLTLMVSGQDDEKPGRATYKVRINGRTVAEGKNIFLEHGWSSMYFSIPKGEFKKGENLIEFVNTTKDKSAGKEDVVYRDGAYMGTRKKQDYSWGWICLSGISLFANDGNFTNWAPPERWYKGKVKVYDNGICEVNRHFRICGKKIIIDPTKKYRISGKFRSVPGSENLKIMFGLAYFDQDGKKLNPVSLNPIPDSSFTLADEAVAGTKEIKVKSKHNKFHKGSYIVFNAREDLKDLPNSEISQVASVSNQKNDKNLFSIVLKRGLPRTYSRGTKMRVHGYKGPLLVGMKKFTPLTQKWQEFSNTISAQENKADLLWDINATCAAPIILDYWHKGAEKEKLQFKDIKIEEIN